MARKKVQAESVEGFDAAPAVNQFELDGKKYNVLHGIGVHLAGGFTKLTAADICVNEEAQKILVEGQSSAIQEVIE